MNLYFETGVWQLRKWGEELCGDHVEILRTSDAVTIAVADGLGSGVKANILATLTTKIAASMLRDGADLDDVMATVAETLPVCRVRELAYSTLALLQMKTNGECYLAEFDSPDAILIQNGQVAPLCKIKRIIADRPIFECHFTMRAEDQVLLITDGIIHAGVGTSLNMGWQWENVASYVKVLNRNGLGLREITSSLINTCSHLYDSRPGDDCTVVGARAMTPMHLTLLTGPPLNQSHDLEVTKTLLEAKGKRVICGGSTAQMVAREAERALNTAMETMMSDLPPLAEMEGVDLVTEGVLTLTSTLGIIRRFATSTEGMTDSKLLKRPDGASRLADLLINHSTHVHLMIGRAINHAHREEEMTGHMGLREQITEDLVKYLRMLGKEVVIEKW